ncbi:MAG TPA: acyl-CoA dehydrogenase family protein [Dehalococcoidia bacterium]|nr:acyl-CoA dehydrogenase family protein [Dehalococcoidia bacterium]
MTSTAKSASDLVLAARDLFPVLNACWAESDRDRRVPASVVQQMKAAGIFRAAVPAELGGPGADLRTFLEVIETVAYANGAAGWDVATSSMATLFAVGLPRSGLERVYGSSPDVIFAGTVTINRDAARAVPTDDGYRVSGRWRFGSGCQDADWMICSAQLVDGGAAPGAVQQHIYAIQPRESVQIIDTWNVIGMRGTGSHDWSVEDALIPADQTEVTSRVQQRILERPWEGLLYHFPLYSIAGLHFTAVATGLARRAIDALVDLAGLKVATRSTSLLRERIQVQDAVARAEAALESAKAYRERTIGEAWQTVAAGESLTMEQRARIRLAGTNAVEASVHAVDLMYNAGGTTSIEEANALSRCFRDVHVVSQSINVSTRNYEYAGRVFLGLEPGDGLTIAF